MTNYLLFRDELGKSKPPTFSPAQSLKNTFGLPVAKDSVNAGLLLSSWKTHKSSHQELRIRDHLKINKAAVAENISSRQEMIKFVNAQDLKQVGRYESRPRGTSLRQASSVRVFGKPSKPPTPVKAVI